MKAELVLDDHFLHNAHQTPIFPPEMGANVVCQLVNTAYLLRYVHISPWTLT